MGASHSMLSPDFKAQPATVEDVKIASIVWGATLGIGLLTGWKAIEQTIAIWHRNRFTRSWYIWMVWVLLIDNFITSVLCWVFMNGQIAPGFDIFFTLITLWMLQVQLLIQIIMNRLALIMPCQRKALRLKWILFLVVLAVNISVYIIWIPARLQISARFMAINDVWDRIEKVIFLIVDGALNAYFLWLVQSRLIANGLEKYRPLFRFNAAIVFVSLSMDILLIAMMSLHNSFTYIQFHPLAYMIKLFIELNMADLIKKIVCSSHVATLPQHSHQNTDDNKNVSSFSSTSAIKSQSKVGGSASAKKTKGVFAPEYVAHISGAGEHPRPSVSVSIGESLEMYGREVPEFGIQKSVRTVVRSNEEGKR